MLEGKVFLCGTSTGTAGGFPKQNKKRKSWKKLNPYAIYFDACCMIINGILSYLCNTEVLPLLHIEEAHESIFLFSAVCSTVGTSIVRRPSLMNSCPFGDEIVHENNLTTGSIIGGSQQHTIALDAGKTDRFKIDNYDNFTAL